MKDFILLIPCYNDIEGLISSVKTINYPYHLFEVMVIDDGSPNPIRLSELHDALPGTTFSIERTESNEGIRSALNKGLESLKARSDYKYIARLDCGDTCHPDRFSQQVSYLDQHQDIDLLGTWCRFVNANNKRSFSYRPKTYHEDIAKEMHYRCSFIHPTVMFRRSVLSTADLYPGEYPHAEDYAFFWLILKNGRTAILPGELVSISYSGSNVSAVNYRTQLVSRINIVKHFGYLKCHKLLGLLLLRFRQLLPVSLIQEMKLLG